MGGEAVKREKEQMEEERDRVPTGRRTRWSQLAEKAWH